MNQSTILESSYDYRLVGLSILIAIFASYTALELAARIASRQKHARWAWLAGGAVAMGTGIWCMHYTGMLAYGLPIPVYYHLPTVLLSLLAAICASLTALYVVSQKQLAALHIGAGSLLMAGGIASMHYTGMAAMRLAAMHQWDRQLVIASVVLAWLVSLAGLVLMKVNLVMDVSRRLGSEGLLKIPCAVLMGLAIPAMHYTAMAAVSYMPVGETPDLRNAIEISALSNAAIIIVSVIVLGSVFWVRLLPNMAPHPVTPSAKRQRLNERKKDFGYLPFER